ncbi:MAG: T9SS type A sorting domain-containing protein [Ignavibacteria bacterium]|nr:T9SS type A sorting domain-containing protein [Ignavibacteria bacterium]
MNRKNFFKAALIFALLFIIIISSYNLSSYAQDTESAKYFPLAVGNIYVYHYYDYPIPVSNYKYKAEITKDTIINGKKYFYFHNFPLYHNEWVRYDSTTGVTLAYSPNNGCAPFAHDKVVDSLSSKLNDVYDGCIYYVWMTRTCDDTSYTNVFGVNTQKKGFHHDGLMVGRVDYAKNFGIIFSNAEEPPGYGSSNTLVGCVINGVVYGDTTLSSIKQISSTTPERYTLYQNYPNPFNPVTKIKFDLRNPSQTKLIVYNTLGKEISTIVNEKLSAGSFEVSWDGNSYPSGVYFYTLLSGDFKETKKMLLLK